MTEDNIFPISIKRGIDYRMTATWYENDGTTAIDLTGYAGTGGIYDRAGGTLLTTFNVTISIPQTSGEVQIFMADTVTSGLAVTPGTCGTNFNYWYKVDLESGTGIKYRFLEGGVYVSD